MNFKCKMCGGELDIDEVNKVATCKYCSSTQSLVNLVNEESIALYDRANAYLKHNEYDKACSIFEELVIDHKEEADLYFSIVLCKYGVKYVDDPKTHKKIPTMNRVQFTSIYDDENYKLALKYATVKQKEFFLDSAAELNRIQKEILEISKNEEPYDIFICYKETDDRGRRTVDSVIAQDLYTILDKKGYKVFFARITLEDKLGIAYEPYIFRALNSARIMIVVGTEKSHVEAVWVENEWSRYLNLMKDDESRILIPVIKGMSAYDLPREFNHLEALDLTGKTDFDELIQVVQKRIGLREEKVDKKQEEKESIKFVDVSDLLAKAREYLNTNDFSSADSVLEEALNKNPMENEIYYYKLLAEFKASKLEDLGNCNKDFSSSYNYKMVLKSNDEKLINLVNKQLELAKVPKKKRPSESLGPKEYKYLKAIETINSPFSAYDYAFVRKDLLSIIDYKDSKELLAKLDSIYEDHGYNVNHYYSALKQLRIDNSYSLTKKEMYEIAETILECPYDIKSFFVARNFLLAIGNYLDRDKLLFFCDGKLKEHGVNPEESVNFRIRTSRASSKTNNYNNSSASSNSSSTSTNSNSSFFKNTLIVIGILLLGPFAIFIAGAIGLFLLFTADGNK